VTLLEWAALETRFMGKNRPDRNMFILFGIAKLSITMTCMLLSHVNHKMAPLNYRHTSALRLVWCRGNCMVALTEVYTPWVLSVVFSWFTSVCPLTQYLRNVRYLLMC